VASTLYLLDTNILSDAMRNPGGPAARRIIATARDEDGAQACTSVVVQCELLFGLRRRTHPHWMERYDRLLSTLEVMPLDAAVPPHYAKLRADLEAQGTPIGPNDSLIAAHALALGATLVTADAEFARVPGLQVQNWLVL
jgi:tRNA(fMet)-specific endonuclease VapC